MAINVDRLIDGFPQLVGYGVDFKPILRLTRWRRRTCAGAPSTGSIGSVDADHEAVERLLRQGGVQHACPCPGFLRMAQAMVTFSEYPETFSQPDSANWRGASGNIFSTPPSIDRYDFVSQAQELETDRQPGPPIQQVNGRPVGNQVMDIFINQLLTSCGAHFE
ncbi:hypothetical protein EJB05_10274, partial [Eragrostis curvula]